MANIELQNITPRHFYETVKCLKTCEHRIYTTVNTVEIHLMIKRMETPAEVEKRFKQLEHIVEFLKELINSSVPTDIDDFIASYSRHTARKFYRKG